MPSKTAVLGILLAAIGTLAAVLSLPEVRSFVGLDKSKAHEERVNRFVVEYLSSSDTTRAYKPKQPSELALYFEFPIHNYYGASNVQESEFYSMIGEYYLLWPQRAYVMTGSPNIIQSSKVREGTFSLVDGAFSYEVSRDVDGEPVKNSGTRTIRIELLERSNGEFKILSVYEFKG